MELRRLRGVLIRTWNLFHGNTLPPQRRAFLREMVELVTRDEPDVVCLQEVPVWALQHLPRWSGMQSVAAVARRPRLGSAALGRALTDIHHGLWRSAFTGEAGAILVAPHYELDEARSEVVGRRPLCRVAHGVRLDRGPYVVNFHTSADPEQLARVAELAEAWPQAIVAGDANIPSASLDGFSPPLAGSIDQILARGLSAGVPVAWPAERRRVGRRLLSDHAPVELEVR
jgi:endonuclease/exonuclease/phosphatase family metal-dependent hydrolase